MKKAVIVLLLLNIFKVKAQSSVLAIADSLYATGNYTKAINYYAKEGSQKASLQIARAYNATGNFEKAFVQYQNVVETNPDWQIASFELGKLLIKTKAYDESRKLFSKLARLSTDNPEYQYYLGEAFRKLNQPASSLVSYKKAVDIDSTHLRSLFQLGKYFVITREKVNAMIYLDKGLRYYSDDVSFINLKALAFYNNDEYEMALPFFERLLELGENKEHVYTKLAYCYFKTWEFEKSKAMYYLLIGIDEGNHEAYFNLGQVFYKNRQVDSAKYYVNKSIEVQKVTFEKEFGNLAYMYRVEEDLKSALTYYRMAYEEDPSTYLNYYQICALIDQTSKKLSEKLKYYESFLEKFRNDKPYVSKRVAKRISELKEEIHFAKD